MEEKDKKKSPVYVLVVKETNLKLIQLYLDNMKSLGLEFENALGQTVELIFIKVFITKMAIEHFSEFFDVGNEEMNNHISFLNESIFSNPFRTPVSNIIRKAQGEVTSSDILIIVNKILESTKFNHNENDFGMSKLIRLKILEDGYPLHDGPASVAGTNDRSLLLRFWSNVSILHKEQPLDLIQRYFGNEVAFYFAWLEYFNIMLVWPSILGAVVFLLSVANVALRDIPEIMDVCENRDMHLCPICELRAHCKFQPVSQYCSQGIWTYVFDNNLTIAFAVFMSFWATLFLTLWKRKENTLKLRWNADCDEEETDIRQAYTDKAKHKGRNRITGEFEPYTPKTENMLRYSVTFLVCGVMIALMIVGVIVNIIIQLKSLQYIDATNSLYLKSNAKILVIFVGCFNQTMIIKLTSLYFGPLSLKLTKFENPKTQHDFDNSVLYKRYLLSFVNNYAPLFYLAFIKGKLYTTPREISGYLARDVCQPENCIVPLCIQITFLLTFRSFAGNILNLLIPKIKWLFTRCFRIKAQEVIILPQWEEEYYLQPTNRYLLTTEFTEMIIKYGLVTFFVAAYPLAPMCALINNMMELRSDAYKLVKIYRRPLPFRTNGIQSWNGILLSVTYVSTATNAFVIAFTSDFIPKQIYLFRHGQGLKGYFNDTLSKFATKDYEPFQKLDNQVEYCYYRGHFFPPDHAKAYQKTVTHWIDFTFRFAAVFVFEHIVLVCNAVLSYCIPKLPNSVREKLTMDQKISKEARIKKFDNSKDKKDKKSKLEVLKIRVD